MVCQEPEGYRGAVMAAAVDPALKDALERKRSYKEHWEFLQMFQNYREVRGGGVSVCLVAECTC